MVRGKLVVFQLGKHQGLSLMQHQSQMMQVKAMEITNDGIYLLHLLMVELTVFKAERLDNNM